MSSEARHHREVVSFVRQRSRMTPAQERAWAELGPRYLLDIPQGVGHGDLVATEQLNLQATFGRDAELIFEIGSGAGDSLVAMAAARPEANVLAFEVFQPGIAVTMIKLAAAGVENVRIVEGNGIHGMQQLVPQRSLSGLWVFFPDPWPKAKHRKRRLINSDFAGLAASRLRPGGQLLCATDWQPYAVQMRKVLDAEPDLINDHPDGWADRPVGRPITRFEGRGEEAGRAIHDLAYHRR